MWARVLRDQGSVRTLSAQNKLICTCTRRTATQKASACRHGGVDAKYLFHGGADLHSQQEASYISHPINKTSAWETRTSPVCVCVWLYMLMFFCECAAKCVQQKDNSTADRCQEFQSTVFNYKTIRESARSILSASPSALFHLSPRHIIALYDSFHN